MSWRTVWPCMRLLTAEVLSAQRYVGPLLIVLMVLIVSLAGGSPSPLSSYAAGAVALLMASAWLTMTTAVAGGVGARAVLITAAGGALTFVTAIVLSVVALCLPVLLVELALPAFTAISAVTPATVARGAVAHSACILTGTAIGLLCSPLLVQKRGYGFLGAILFLLATVLAPVSPAALGLRALSEETPMGLSDMMWPLASGGLIVWLSVQLVGRLAPRLT